MRQCRNESHEPAYARARVRQRCRLKKSGRSKGESKILKLSKVEEERALELHRKAIIIDGNIPWGNLDDLKNVKDIIEGGLSAANFTAAHWPHNFLGAINRLSHYKKIIEENQDMLALATTVDDIKKFKKEGKFSIIMAFQDGKPIEDNLDNIRLFHDLGVRVIQLTYNSQNFIGTGCCEPSYGKLTYFGRKVVTEMNRLGIVIDLSHCCDETTMDAIELSKDPVIFSHSSIRSLCNAYGRNKTDEQIKALAEKGGVTGICFAPALIKRDEKTYKVKRSTINDVLNHIDYAIDLVGPNHVGFGSDIVDTWLDEKRTPPSSSLRWWRPIRPDVFGKGPTERYDPFPVGIDRFTKFLNLTRGLVARGYSDSEILKILGENFLRVYEKIWRASQA